MGEKRGERRREVVVEITLPLDALLKMPPFVVEKSFYEKFAGCSGEYGVKVCWWPRTDRGVPEWVYEMTLCLVSDEDYSVEELEDLILEDFGCWLYDIDLQLHVQEVP